MITGAHVLLFSQDSNADLAFFRDVLSFRAVDAGGGWLIFKLPPAETAVHPVDPKEDQAIGHMLDAHLYLMCDDLQAQMTSLKAKNVECTAVVKERWGIRTTIKLPERGRDRSLPADASYRL
jgi:hypothetical protein